MATSSKTPRKDGGSASDSSTTEKRRLRFATTVLGTPTKPHEPRTVTTRAAIPEVINPNQEYIRAKQGQAHRLPTIKPALAELVSDSVTDEDLMLDLCYMSAVFFPENHLAQHTMVFASLQQWLTWASSKLESIDANSIRAILRLHNPNYIDTVTLLAELNAAREELESLHTGRPVNTAEFTAFCDAITFILYRQDAELIVADRRGADSDNDSDSDDKPKVTKLRNKAIDTELRSKAIDQAIAPYITSWQNNTTESKAPNNPGREASTPARRSHHNQGTLNLLPISSCEKQNHFMFGNSVLWHPAELCEHQSRLPGSMPLALGRELSSLLSFEPVIQYSSNWEVFTENTKTLAPPTRQATFKQLWANATPYKLLLPLARILNKDSRLFDALLANEDAESQYLAATIAVSHCVAYLKSNPTDLVKSFYWFRSSYNTETGKTKQEALSENHQNITSAIVFGLLQTALVVIGLNDSQKAKILTCIPNTNRPGPGWRADAMLICLDELAYAVDRTIVRCKLSSSVALNKLLTIASEGNVTLTLTDAAIKNYINSVWPELTAETQPLGRAVSPPKRTKGGGGSDVEMAASPTRGNTSLRAPLLEPEKHGSATAPQTHTLSPTRSGTDSLLQALRAPDKFDEDDVEAQAATLASTLKQQIPTHPKLLALHTLLEHQLSKVRARHASSQLNATQKIGQVLLEITGTSLLDTDASTATARAIRSRASDILAQQAHTTWLATPVVIRRWQKPHRRRAQPPGSTASRGSGTAESATGTQTPTTSPPASRRGSVSDRSSPSYRGTAALSPLEAKLNLGCLLLTAAASYDYFFYGPEQSSKAMLATFLTCSALSTIIQSARLVTYWKHRPLQDMKWGLNLLTLNVFSCVLFSLHVSYHNPLDRPKGVQQAIDIFGINNYITFFCILLTSAAWLAEKIQAAAYSKSFTQLRTKENLWLQYTPILGVNVTQPASWGCAAAIFAFYIFFVAEPAKQDAFTITGADFFWTPFIAAMLGNLLLGWRLIKQRLNKGSWNDQGALIAFWSFNFLASLSFLNNGIWPATDDDYLRPEEHDLAIPGTMVYLPFFITALLCTYNLLGQPLARRVLNESNVRFDTLWWLQVASVIVPAILTTLNLYYSFEKFGPDSQFFFNGYTGLAYAASWAATLAADGVIAYAWYSKLSKNNTFDNHVFLSTILPLLTCLALSFPTYKFYALDARQADENSSLYYLVAWLFVSPAAMFAITHLTSKASARLKKALPINKFFGVFTLNILTIVLGAILLSEKNYGQLVLIWISIATLFTDISLINSLPAPAPAITYQAVLPVLANAATLWLISSYFIKFPETPQQIFTSFFLQLAGGSMSIINVQLLSKHQELLARMVNKTPMRQLLSLLSFAASVLTTSLLALHKVDTMKRPDVVTPITLWLGMSGIASLLVMINQCQRLGSRGQERKRFDSNDLLSSDAWTGMPGYTPPGDPQKPAFAVSLDVATHNLADYVPTAGAGAGTGAAAGMPLLAEQKSMRDSGASSGGLAVSAEAADLYSVVTGHVPTAGAGVGAGAGAGTFAVAPPDRDDPPSWSSTTYRPSTGSQV